MAQARYQTFVLKVILRGPLSCKDIRTLQLSFAISVMRPFSRAQLKGNTKRFNKTLFNRTSNQLQLDNSLRFDLSAER